jgi:predicted dienelactone hydrolase
LGYKSLKESIMKRSLFLLLVLVFINSIAMAQLPIGHKSLTYQDPARSNRNVTTEIYYPATSAGDNTPFATGQFPLIVFGHGFVMGYDAYLYFKDAMVPSGYIVVFATTESGSPNHANFGADLAFLVNKMKSEASSNSSSPFYNKLSATSAIMGHSMGGGASFLACANNTTPTCMVTFAAANTSNPTSISVADQISIPSLVISGAADCVAAPASNQLPMYDSLASACKIFLSIKNGCHCYFGDYNFNCTFGESTCNAVPSLARSDQQDVTLDFVKLYLDYYLKGNSSSLNAFNDSLTTSNRITYQKNCTTTLLNSIPSSLNDLSVYPNPAKNSVTISFMIRKQSDITFDIYNISGVLVHSEKGIYTNGNYQVPLNITGFSKGVYTIKISADKSDSYQKLIIE